MARSASFLAVFAFVFVIGLAGVTILHLSDARHFKSATGGTSTSTGAKAIVPSVTGEAQRAVQSVLSSMATATGDVTMTMTIAPKASKSACGCSARTMSVKPVVVKAAQPTAAPAKRSCTEQRLVEHAQEQRKRAARRAMRLPSSPQATPGVIRMAQDVQPGETRSFASGDVICQCRRAPRRFRCGTCVDVVACKDKPKPTFPRCVSCVDAPKPVPVVRKCVQAPKPVVLKACKPCAPKPRIVVSCKRTAERTEVRRAVASTGASACGCGCGGCGCGGCGCNAGAAMNAVSKTESSTVTIAPAKTECSVRTVFDAVPAAPAGRVARQGPDAREPRNMLGLDKLVGAGVDGLGALERTVEGAVDGIASAVNEGVAKAFKTHVYTDAAGRVHKLRAAVRRVDLGDRRPNGPETHHVRVRVHEVRDGRAYVPAPRPEPIASAADGLPGVAGVRDAPVVRFEGRRYRCWANVPRARAFAPETFGRMHDVLIRGTPTDALVDVCVRAE